MKRTYGKLSRGLTSRKRQGLGECAFILALVAVVAIQAED